MATPRKDTIYIDVDDEITAIVDKVQNSESKITALVLPKRAVVLQSIVNMKLLKRAADDAGKRIVLITSEAALLPMAGVVGVHVAKNLQSKPEIPPPPEMPAAEDELLESEDPAEVSDKKLDTSATIGELVEDDVFEGPKPKAASKKAAKTSELKKTKKNKVPNFDSFRKKVFIGALAVILLLVFGYLAFFVMPKATVVVKTQTSTISSSVVFTASTEVDAVNIDDSLVPAKLTEKQVTHTERVAATGQKDMGTKASGSVTLSIACSAVSGLPPRIPAGTGVSNNNLTYITQSNVSLTNPSFSDGCRFSGSVDVIAQNNGDQYNLASGRTFSVAGFSSVTATNPSAFSGGTSKMAKVVSQQDVDTATQQIPDSADEVKSQLQDQLAADGYLALADTFVAKDESVVATPQVDQEADEVAVTASQTYVMFGVKRDDLRKLIEDAVSSETQSRNLRIQDDGIDSAIYRINSTESGQVAMTIQTQVVLGPEIDESKLKEDIAGKKRGDAQSIVRQIGGVEDVEISFSPFWVGSVPKGTGRITVELQEAD